MPGGDKARGNEHEIIHHKFVPKGKQVEVYIFKDEQWMKHWEERPGLLRQRRSRVRRKSKLKMNHMASASISRAAS